MIETIKHLLGIFITVPLMTLVGLYLSIKLNFVQFTQLKQAFKSLITPDKSAVTSDGSAVDSKKSSAFSSFNALAAVLGGNLGTGNIAGIAVALASGGPGSLFWMWVMAALGSIVKFSSCYLGIKYRLVLPSFGLVGGPMYYLDKGLNFKLLAKIYCIFLVCSSLTVGNLVQVNSLALPFSEFGIPSWILGGGLVILVGWVLLGGLKSFTQVISKTVPFMAVVYVVSCIIILFRFYANIADVLQLIIQSAFSPKSLLGGALGFSIFDAIRSGFDRGLFATDAGLGLEAMLHAQVRGGDDNINKMAFSQAIITTVAPIVVMIICSLTGLVLLATNASTANPSLQSTNLCISAFNLGLSSNIGGYIVLFTLFLFAFTTILTWAHCAEQAFEYLWPHQPTFLLRSIFIAVIPLGVTSQVSLIWSLADIAINLMLIINLIGIIGLGKEVLQGVLLNRKARDDAAISEQNAVSNFETSV